MHIITLHNIGGERKFTFGASINIIAHKVCAKKIIKKFEHTIQPLWAEYWASAPKPCIIYIYIHA